MTPPLTPRQERERNYYDEFAALQQDFVIDLAPIAGLERRPWNPYWHLYQMVQERYRPNARLLDFGCGWGATSMVFAHMGYEVAGFDVSEGNLHVARQLAMREGFGDRAKFDVQTAEHLSYAEATFDVVVGIDILHHVEIGAALMECRRVLKPGGVAYFREPIENRFFDTLRNTAMGRWLKSNAASHQSHITEDERKLTRGGDLAAIKQIFPNCKIDCFRMLSRLDALVPRATMLLEKVDHRLTVLPGFSSMCGTVVLTLEKTLPRPEVEREGRSQCASSS